MSNEAGLALQIIAFLIGLNSPFKSQTKVPPQPQPIISKTRTDSLFSSELLLLCMYTFLKYLITDKGKTLTYIDFTSDPHIEYNIKIN